MTRPTLSLLVLTLIGAVALPACDLFAASKEKPPISASGTVVHAETGEPFAGLGVTISEVISGAHVVVSVQTDPEGHFALSYDPPDPIGAAPLIGYFIDINNAPYDARYKTAGKSAFPGDVIDFGVVEIARNVAP